MDFIQISITHANMYKLVHKKPHTTSYDTKYTLFSVVWSKPNGIRDTRYTLFSVVSSKTNGIGDTKYNNGACSDKEPNN